MSVGPGSGSAHKGKSVLLLGTCHLSSDVW